MVTQRHHAEVDNSGDNRAGCWERVDVRALITEDVGPTNELRPAAW